MPDELDPRHLWRRVAQLALVAALVVAVVAAVPGLSGIRNRIAHADPAWLVVAAAAQLAAALSYIALFRSVFCQRMRWGLSAQIGMSELAADALLPGGGTGGLALGAWALSRGGMSTGHIARRTVVFFLATSAANFAIVILAGLGLALGVLPGRASLALTLTPALGAAAIIVLVVVVLPRLLDRFAPRSAPPASSSARGRAHRFIVNASSTVADGVRETVSLLRAGRPLVVVGSLGYLAFDIVVLGACFRAFGPVPPLGTLLLAYVLGQLGGLLPLPGGIGGVDAGLIGALVLYGTPLAPATTAVLVYHALHLLLPVLLGVPAFVGLRRALRRAEDPMMICAPLADAGAAAAS